MSYTKMNKEFSLIACLSAPSGRSFFFPVEGVFIWIEGPRLEDVWGCMDNKAL